MRALRVMRNLAGGRMPPLTRTALLSGLAAFLISLVAFRPVAPTYDRAPIAGQAVVILSPEDPLAQRAALLDESLAFLPSGGEPLSSSSGYQISPEGTPFAVFPPRLRFEANRRPDLPAESNFSRTSTPLEAINPLKGDLFSTFSSQKAPLGSIKPRSFRCLIIPSGLGQGSPMVIDVGDNPTFKPFKDNIYSFKALIGIDSLGLLGKPTILTSTGDLKLDQAAIGWVGGQEWHGKLPPGLYQICLGP